MILLLILWGSSMVLMLPNMAVDVLKKSLERLRSMSPLYEDYIKKEKCQ